MRTPEVPVAAISRLSEVEVSLSTLLTGKGPFSKFNGEFLWEHRWTDLIFLFAMVAALRILSTFFLAFVKYKTV